ncbi:hypothetical protein LIY60_23955, partial [Escherichia coli]|nr:hypothetical protein [Escherichia coli]
MGIVRSGHGPYRRGIAFASDLWPGRWQDHSAQWFLFDDNHPPALRATSRQRESRNSPDRELSTSHRRGYRQGERDMSKVIDIMS